MNQPPLSDSTSNQPLQHTLQQNAESSTLGGGIQGTQGNNNIQIQGSENQVNNINLTLVLNEKTIEQTKNSEQPIITESGLVIESSGSWVLLQGYFFQTETVRQHQDGTLTVMIPSESSQDDATIQSLRPDRWGQSQLTTFAYRNDGFLVKVEEIEAESRRDSYIWKLTLKPANIEYGGSTFEMSYQERDQTYSADDIANLRGRRILLNDPPKQVIDAKFYRPASANNQMLETLIRGINTPIQVENCVLQPLYSVYKDRPKLFLELARLMAIFSLKAGDVVEQVLELALGPIEQASVHVRFRGRRRKKYVNVEPSIIEIEGDCPLE